MNKIVWINAINGARIIIDKNSDKRNVKMFGKAIKESCYQIIK